jgi:hypothetical protein
MQQTAASVCHSGESLNPGDREYLVLSGVNPDLRRMTEKTEFRGRFSWRMVEGFHVRQALLCHYGQAA